MYRHGKSVPQSNEEAVRWYRLSAEQGNDDAIKALAEILEE
ncbi:MAG: SEL1-like repeat protein [Methanomassiliicoccaceae archaeon]|nr:SEL1-like repeat protein [Methanomassiliicoccaceae archaeon]MCL2145969.1 SEL1-like repeat protein [Methanomassiliicoccaceae archaeon]